MRPTTADLLDLRDRARRKECGPDSDAILWLLGRDRALSVIEEAADEPGARGDDLILLVGHALEQSREVTE